MSRVRIGSLFSGYGGLCELAVAPLLGGNVVWHCDSDPAAAAVLAHHRPHTPNLGDISQVAWSAVEPVEVLVGGFPCQDLSSAGRRAGLTPGTRSGLWAHMATAVDRLRPSLVVFENVRGLLSA
ncbi:DNA cytosine methyltransferase, partial [Longimycelium tulufanense]|uniref:DNA cytosine methyltransferase n=1 Tax=Longimycelium tulufanense TaxID=907463 RepID=UPI00166A908E